MGPANHVLTSSAAGGIAVTYAPGRQMLATSLTHRGAELLGPRGIPLLHPWANRLARRRFAAAGREVDVERAGDAARYDPDRPALPIHGLRSEGWEVLAAGAAQLSARLAFGAEPALLAAFPFPHELRVEAALHGATLTVTTTLRATGDVAVPASFGYHPYLVLPGVARADWEVVLPVRERIVVDGDRIPTGERVSAGDPSGPLGTRTFDDGYTVAPGAVLALAGGGRRIEVAFAEHYPVAQVYAPPHADVVALEPMVAPANALLSGDGLVLVAPGDAFTATYAVTVAET
jgi:aldose 1-epimerase